MPDRKPITKLKENLKNDYSLEPSDIDLLEYLNQINNTNKHHISDTKLYSDNDIWVYAGSSNSKYSIYLHAHKLRDILAGFNRVFYTLMKKQHSIDTKLEE